MLTALSRPFSSTTYSISAVSLWAVNRGCGREASDLIHYTTSSHNTDGNHTDSMLTRPAADRFMAGPEALTMGTIPNNIQCIPPCPSTKLSLPRIDMPYIRTAAVQIIPRSQQMTSSAENGHHPFN